MTFQEFKKTQRYQNWLKTIPNGMKHAIITDEEMTLFIEYLQEETTLLNDKTIKEQVGTILTLTSGWGNPNQIRKYYE